MIGNLIGGIVGWKAYALAGVGLLLVVTSATAYHTWTVEGLQKELRFEEKKVAQCGINIAALQANIGDLTGTLNRQSLEVERMAAAGVQSSATADANASEALRLAGERRLADGADQTAGPDRMNGFFSEVTP